MEYQKFKMWVFLIPTSTVRLFSPHEYFKQEGKWSFLLLAAGCIFEFPPGRKITFTYSDRSSLPIAMSYVKKETGVLNSFLSALPTHKLSISKAQEELLLWNEIFGHYYIRHTQILMSPRGNDGTFRIITKVPGTASCSILLCS